MSLALNLVPVHQWLSALQKDQEAISKPIVISGPCSVETEEQVMQTAQELVEHAHIHILRGGIWKPRTRPGSFQGVEEVGLPWLKQAGQAIGKPVATEVANAQHVEACLKADIDILWIGARTTVNPFFLQEIADALQGVDIPVFVKNPVNPDLQLWLGALERLNRAGITKLAAIHRGFSSFGDTPYRNAPNWQIPIELRTLVPNIDILCDPSHICGNREYLGDVTQKALDLDMSGFMIESHINPDAAKSDAAQQITPKRLGQLISELAVRDTDTDNPAYQSRLEELRSVIDEIDSTLLKALAERMRIVEQIGDYKLENNVTILQLDRWRDIIRTRTNLGTDLGLSEEFIVELLKQLHRASISLQTEVMNKRTVGDA